MNAKELIKTLQRLPKDMQDMEVRYAVDKGRGKRTLCAINQVENYQNAWIILKFQDR